MSEDNIRICIRTGTSTRPAQTRHTETWTYNNSIRPAQTRPIETRTYSNSINTGISPIITHIPSSEFIFTRDIGISQYPPLAILEHSAMSFMQNFLDVIGTDSLEYILERTTNEDDLTRDDDIDLDICARPCINSETESNCTICLQKFNIGDRISDLPCSHKFHTICITEWGKYKQECPLCRERIATIN